MSNYRNVKALRAAQGEPCRHCFIQNGTIVAAHSNLGEHGKGMGIKAHDCFIAFLCHECHKNYDSGFMLQYMFEKAMRRTQVDLIERRILTPEIINGHYNEWGG